MDMDAESGNAIRLSAPGRMLDFWNAQARDWKITVARTSLERLSYQMIFPYLSVYIIALGATKTQLGFLNSVGIILAGLLSPYAGWLIDRDGPKKVYLIGIGLLAAAYLTYAWSPSWIFCGLAMGLHYIGSGTGIHSCATICGHCLANASRARGMMICETIAAGLLGMAGPMMAAWLTARTGGVTVDGIRPLFMIAVAFTALSYLLVRTQLTDRKLTARFQSGRSLLHDGFEILKGNRSAQKWLAIAAMTQLPMGMILPFTQVYAQEVKGADGWVLGAMVTGTALTSIVFGYPSGALADRFGRKKVLYLMIPLFWASCLTLIWAPNPAVLVLSGILVGFQYILMPIGATIERELVPAEQMGRWIGLVRLVKALFGASMAAVGGLVWDRLGPEYLFLTYLALDVVIRIPLLVSLPETLKRPVATLSSR